MANKNSRPSNKNKSSGSSSKKSRHSSNSSGSSWFQRFGTRNLLIVTAFVVVFATAGTIYLNKTKADTYAGHPCVQFTFSINKAWGSQCVKDIQFGLQREGYYYGTVDGKFGPITQGAVVNFGRTWGYNNSGQVGARTWNSLCKLGLAKSNGGFGHYPSVAVAMGCMNGVWNGAYTYQNWFGSSNIL